MSTEIHAADFYDGKTIEIIIPTSPGGDYDVRARLIARHLNKFIPGKPTIVARNMSGAVGMQAANYMANQARTDGTSLHIIYQPMPIMQAIGNPAVRYDVRAFGWIGSTSKSPNIVNSWHSTGITKIEDVMTRELVVGSSGSSSPAFIYPMAMNAVVGTNFKVITGYPGGNDVNLAMEKGEVGGRGSNSLASWESQHAHWIADKKIFFLVQVGLARHERIKDVPLMMDLAKNDQDKAVLRLISADVELSRAIVTTPNVPADRVALLRSAFDEMISDPGFLAEAKQMKVDISATPGIEAQAIAKSIIDQPETVLNRVKTIMAGGQ